MPRKTKKSSTPGPGPSPARKRRTAPRPAPRPARRPARRPVADIRRRARFVLRELGKLHPKVRTALRYSNSLELLVATILSAQCTDVRVNLVTRALFRRYKTAEEYADAPTRELERAIYSTGFFRQKARAIRKAGRELIRRFDGKVPRTMKDLVSLHGVGRKTANVILDQAFGRAEGIAVDTHVSRLSRRLGLTAEKNPERIERDLMSIVPRKAWGRFSLLLIEHGRAVCGARRPDCAACTIAAECPAASVDVNSRRKR